MANDGEYTIFEYCRRNDVEGLMFLLRSDTNTNINAKDDGGNTALHIPAIHTSKECLKLLLEAGAEINAKNNFGNTPLHIDVSWNSKECLQLLLEAGADVTIKNSYGSTPLHYAALHNSKECLKLLLESGADPNIKNRYGRTPLDLLKDEKFKKEIEEYIQELSAFNIKEPSC